MVNDWVSAGFLELGGTLLGGSYDKDCNFMGSIFGSRYFGKLPCNTKVPKSVVFSTQDPHRGLRASGIRAEDLGLQELGQRT